VTLDPAGAWRPALVYLDLGGAVLLTWRTQQRPRLALGAIARPHGGAVVFLGLDRATDVSEASAVVVGMIHQERKNTIYDALARAFDGAFR
jgi:hypothetical protein